MLATNDNMESSEHYIRPNRVGYFITEVDDQPVFRTPEEATNWAKEKGITLQHP